MEYLLHIIATIIILLQCKKLLRRAFKWLVQIIARTVQSTELHLSINLQEEVGLYTKSKNIEVTMTSKNKSCDAVLASRFDKLEYAQGYLINIVENEGFSIDEALRETIKAMGVQRFTDQAGISIQEVSDFVANRHQWSNEKLSKLIEKVFKLKVKLLLEPSNATEAT